jgi:hypothetical protein
MFRKPYLNALLAAIYILLIVYAIQFVTSRVVLQETILIPIAMLSLLVLSVATMGALFFYQPVRMYLEGAKREAVIFFGKTLATFACFVLVVVALVILVK